MSKRFHWLPADVVTSELDMQIRVLYFLKLEKFSRAARCTAESLAIQRRLTLNQFTLMIEIYKKYIRGKSYPF